MFIPEAKMKKREMKKVNKKGKVVRSDAIAVRQSAAESVGAARNLLARICKRDEKRGSHAPALNTPLPPPFGHSVCLRKKKVA